MSRLRDAIASILKRCLGRDADAARLTAIHVAAAAGRPMHATLSIRAVEGVGLEGDRYAAKTGFWKATDACQVTLITERDLRRARTAKRPELRARLRAGHHRRNLVIDGLDAGQLDGRRFRIGSAVFVYDKPRPPCGYLDKVEGDGMCHALGRHSGVCLKVVRGGTLTVGDAVELLDGDDR